MLFGGVNGRLGEGSRQGELPRTSAASVLIPTVKQSHHLPRQETPQHQQVRLVQSPPGSLLLPLGSSPFLLSFLGDLIAQAELTFPVPVFSSHQILPWEMLRLQRAGRVTELQLLTSQKGPAGGWQGGPDLGTLPGLPAVGERLDGSQWLPDTDFQGKP